MAPEQGTGPAGGGTGSGTQVGAEVNTRLPRRPDSLPARAYRRAVLRTDPLDAGILAALVLTLPLAVGR